MSLEYDIVKSLMIVLLLGFMIGMQRTIYYVHIKKEENSIGSRTFALISLTGYLSGWIDSFLNGFIFISFFAVSVLIFLNYFFKTSKMNKSGITTQLSALITYMLGMMVYFHLENYAIFIAVVMIVLLEIKPALKRFEANVSSTDINAIMLLLVMSFVVLPILPDEMIGKYKLFNPYKTWLMAIIISAISFIGYAAIKILGNKRGVFLTGAFGGLISSTAVSISLSKLSVFQKEYLNNFTGGIAIACTFMYLRVLFEAFIIYPDFSLYLTFPYLLAAFSGLIFSYYIYKHSKSADIKFENPTMNKNPLQLSEAIKFGTLFGIIYGAISFIQTRYGSIGIYIISFFSGITDVDAITLSLSQLAKDEKLPKFVSINGIVIASVTNSFVKLGIVYWLGGAKLGWKLTQFFLLTLSLMGIGLWLSEVFIK